MKNVKLKLTVAIANRGNNNSPSENFLEYIFRILQVLNV